MPRALIAGAGIAGLAAALALNEAGYEAVVFERRGELAEFGAGLQITPNASRVLEKLGALGASSRRWRFEPGAIVIRRGGTGTSDITDGEHSRRRGCAEALSGRARSARLH